MGHIPGGLQIKSFYRINRWEDEHVHILSSHGTPLYVTAIVENHAGLQSTFHSNGLIIDHTPPVIEEVEVSIHHIYRNTTFVGYVTGGVVQLKASWKPVDNESHIKICYYFIG